MVKPISPAEAKERFVNSIPSEVFDAFNELIVANMVGNRSSFTNADLLPLIRQKLEAHNRPTDIKGSWLDVYKAYNDLGWEVDIDRPGYNESYSTIYTFKS